MQLLKANEMLGDLCILSAQHHFLMNRTIKGFKTFGAIGLAFFAFKTYKTYMEKSKGLETKEEEVLELESVTTEGVQDPLVIEEESAAVGNDFVTQVDDPEIKHVVKNDEQELFSTMDCPTDIDIGSIEPLVMEEEEAEALGTDDLTTQTDDPKENVNINVNDINMLLDDYKVNQIELKDEIKSLQEEKQELVKELFEKELSFKLQTAELKELKQSLEGATTELKGISTENKTRKWSTEFRNKSIRSSGSKKSRVTTGGLEKTLFLSKGVVVGKSPKAYSSFQINGKKIISKGYITRYGRLSRPPLRYPCPIEKYPDAGTTVEELLEDTV